MPNKAKRGEIPRICLYLISLDRLTRGGEQSIMIISFITVYSFISVVLAAIDFYFGYKAFQKAEKIGRYLGMVAIAAGLVSLSYLVSIRTQEYHIVSIASSVYFVGIDLLLVSLAHFVFWFTGRNRKRTTRLLKVVMLSYALFDGLVFLINIFHEIAVHYEYRATAFAVYAYEMKPLYIMHLIYTYVLVAMVLYILVDKCRQAPRQYQNQYLLIILAIMIVVLVNAIFLYPDSKAVFTLIDYSILGYSVGLYLMYWAAFEYRQNDMLKSLSMTIFENIHQGIVLFDYEGCLIMHNAKAEELLRNVRFSDKMRVAEFAGMCQIPEDTAEKDQYSIQCETPGRPGQPLRCDYRRLQDANGGTTGKLFTFTDVTNDFDILTGYQHWEDFQRFCAENPGLFDHPTAVVMFDIVGLAEINRTFGRDVGDSRIRTLSKVVRRVMPDDAYYVRGYEAHLVVICPGKTEEQMEELVQQVMHESAGTILYGMSMTLDPTSINRGDAEENEEGRNVLQTITKAGCALQSKKLLSIQSSHSQTLSSLVRALQESDSDTEAHVQRTQKMGAALGRRIHLCDAQLADLNLLCLLHDIGKIGIPLEILNKPGRLTDSEWEVLRTHAEKGYQIAMSSEELKSIARLILCHHERWDGKGYPQKLSGKSIPVLSRIIAIVDAYDAMVNNRSYRKGKTPEEAQEEMRRCAGTQFDPNLVEEFLAMLMENPNIARGEKIGGSEVRVFLENRFETVESGNTFPVAYSRYLLDLDETIIEVDPAFEEITGYTASETVGKKTQFDLVPPEDLSYYILQVNNQFSKGNIAFLKHEILRKDGGKIWVVCCGKRFFDSSVKAFRSEILIFRTTGTELDF